MSRSQLYEAIVLRTYDVGEADRFCILLTREAGRLAARARAVRKPRSHMGGALLPLKHITVMLTETNGGYLVTSAAVHKDSPDAAAGVASFAVAEQGVELLLSLTEEEEALPGIFDQTLHFLRLTTIAPSGNLVLGYTLRLLRMMGLLPDAEHAEYFRNLSTEESSFIAAAIGNSLSELPPLASRERLQRLCLQFLEGQISAPLRAPAVVAALA